MSTSHVSLSIKIFLEKKNAHEMRLQSYICSDTGKFWENSRRKFDLAAFFISEMLWIVSRATWKVLGKQFKLHFVLNHSFVQIFKVSVTNASFSHLHSTYCLLKSLLFWNKKKLSNREYYLEMYWSGWCVFCIYIQNGWEKQNP